MNNVRRFSQMYADIDKDWRGPAQGGMAVRKMGKHTGLPPKKILKIWVHLRPN